MFLSYKAKKIKLVHLFSFSNKSTTLPHRQTTIDDGEQKKLQGILDYNVTKGGVDIADKMLCTYSTKAASQRYPLG